MQVSICNPNINKNILLSLINSFKLAYSPKIDYCHFFSFFLDTSCVGQSRAKSSMQLLQELNPDVTSDFLDESVDSIIENNPEFFISFNVVVASSLKEKTLIALSQLLWNHNIPLVYCRSVGFIASARLQYKEHCIIETHPDNKQFDLRLEQPFPALLNHLEVSNYRE